MDAKVKFMMFVFAGASIGHSVVTISWLSAYLAIIKVGPGKVMGFVFAFYFSTLVTIVVSVFAILGLKMNKSAIFEVYTAFTIGAMIYEIVLGILPIIFYTWAFDDLYDVIHGIPTTYIYLDDIEEVYGCCGYKKATNRFGAMSSACCGDRVECPFDHFMSKPPCFDVIPQRSHYMLTTIMLIYSIPIIQGFGVHFARKITKELIKSGY